MVHPVSGQSNELKEGIEAFRKGDYFQARVTFTKILETRIGSPELENAQWYLAQTHEKEHSLQLAIEQYRLFLKNYPASTYRIEAERKLEQVTKEIASGPDIINNMDQKENGEHKSEPMIATPPPKPAYPDQLSGVFILEYLNDNVLLPSPSLNTLNRLNEYFDLRWRKRREKGSDIRIYFSEMYANDFLNPNNSQNRLSKLYMELNNYGVFSNLRIGRQPASGSTLFNRFDGLSMGFPIINFLTLNVSAGLPVDMMNFHSITLQTLRRFYETNLTISDFHYINGKIYYTQEFYQDFSTRQAVGINGFWSQNNLNITTVIDRDIDFNEFNDGLVNVDYGYSTTHFFGSVEYRRNPFLDYGNAIFDPSLMGQTPPVSSLGDLQQIMTREQIHSLALKNSSTTLDSNLGTSFDLSAVWRLDLRYGRTLFNPDLSRNPITFPASDADKTLDRYSLSILEKNGLQQMEFGTLLILLSTGTDSQTTTAMGTLTKPWNSGLQGTLRFRWEDILYKTIDTQFNRLIPGFSIKFTFQNRMEASLDFDYTFEQNNTAQDTLNTVQTRTSLTVPF